MEEITSAFMLKWTAVALGTSFVVALLGALIVAFFEDKHPRIGAVGVASLVIGICAASLSAVFFFISLIWHIIKSFTGG